MSLYFYLHNHINWSGGRQTGWTEGEFGYKIKAVVVEDGGGVFNYSYISCLIFRHQLKNFDANVSFVSHSYLQRCDSRKKYFFYNKIIQGTDGATKSDEISEKFQTAFDPPLSLIFGKLCIFFGKRPKNLYKGPKSAT